MVFTLNNKTELINLNGYIPSLTLPTTFNLGNLDNVVSELVRKLKDRNFMVNGIDVKFDLNGVGKSKNVSVNEIKGNDFKIIFNETGFVKIIIPKLMFQRVNIHLCNDSLIILYKYSGENWNNNKQNFYDDVYKSNSKKENREKTYVVYDTLFSGQSSILKHNNYNGSEYDLDEDDKHNYSYQLIENEIIDFLKLVIEYIDYSKEEFFNINIFKEPAKIKLKNKLTGGIYTFIHEDDYKRLHYLRSNIDEDNMLPAVDYGLIPQIRLVPICNTSAVDLDDIVHDGFIWAEICDVEPSKPKATHNVFKNDFIPVKLYLHNFANVFVVDKHIQNQKRKEIFSKYKSPTSITTEDYDEIECALATTMIHINDYKNDYIEPIILIKRELHPDEIFI